MISSANGVREVGYSHIEEQNYTPVFPVTKKSNGDEFKNLHVRPEIMTLLKENRGNTSRL